MAMGATSAPSVALRGSTGRTEATATVCPTCDGAKRTDARLCRSCWLAEDRTGDRAARFWARVDATGGVLACWPFIGNGTAAGYGQLSIGRGTGRMVAAHRLSYELAVGPIPSGMVVRHTCDNPPCVNPAHLVIGAQLDNVRDMVERGRRRGRSLTADQVAEVRRRAAAGESYRDLAASAGVDASTVGRIVKGRTWATVR